MTPIHTTNQVPYCPKCGTPMVLRYQRRDRNKTFWGCTQYFKTGCNGLVNVWDAHMFLSPLTEKKWTQQQEEIFARAAEGGRHVVVKAGPGTGKTTTNVEAGKRLGIPFLGLAFNAHIANEWKAKSMGNEIRTTHSFALRELHSALGDFEVDEKNHKYWSLIRTQLDAQKSIKENDRQVIGQQLKRLVDLMRCTLNHDVLSLADHFGIPLDYDPGLMQMMAKFVLEQGRKNKDLIDFTDMLYYIWYHKIPVRRFDRILGDEVQDWNAAQLYLVQQALGSNGQLIAVGDEHQSLYGFRGADCDSIPNLIEAFDAEIMPLTLSFRCARAIVAQANKIVPELEAAPDAPEGEVTYATYEDILRDIRPGHMLLCRTNAPLVKPIFELIRQGVKATIRGRDIGKGLKAYVEKFEKEAASLPELIRHMEEHTRAQVSKLISMDRGSSAQAVQDKAETIIQIGEVANSIPDLYRKIDTIFDELKPSIVGSTVHRVKGLEAEEVVVLRPDLMPHPLAKRPWEMKQEFNCMYVACTRAKTKLTYELVV